MATRNTASEAVIAVRDTLSAEQLRAITPATVKDVLAEHGATVEDVTAFGSGFEILKDKSTLIGVPLIIISWTSQESKEYTDEDGNPLLFVSAYVVTGAGDKYIVNDGSTGLSRQLLGIEETRRKAGNPHPAMGIVVPKGLVKNSYTFVDDKGRSSSAETYYLSGI